MGLSETLLFYATVGLAVAAAVYLRTETKTAGEGAFKVLTSFLFWPLYLVLLLSGAPHDEPRANALSEVRDEMAAAIDQVDAELAAALSSLDGWAEDVLAREKDRIQELRFAWNAQAARVREMDRLLVQSDFAAQKLASGPLDSQPPAGAPGTDRADRRSQSEFARRKNVERLRQVRRQSYEDLMGTLAWVRELVSMIHLAKFTGAPASRAEELIAQIAAAVEGVSAVTWQESSEATGRATSFCRTRVEAVEEVEGVPPSFFTASTPSTPSAASTPSTSSTSYKETTHGTIPTCQ